MSDPVDKIRKLVERAGTGGNPQETAVAARKAREAIAALDVKLLDTLAGQRKRLVEDLQEEALRLIDPKERATKDETGELVSRASLLLRHYEQYDALIAAVLLLRVEGGHRLANDERQQLDGPVESFLDQWNRASRERRKTERKERREKARDERRRRSQETTAQ